MSSGLAINLSYCRLHYRRTGTGPAILLFHGFGQDSHAFDAWQGLDAAHTVYAMDLFFHGSEWNSDAPVTKDHWKEIMNLFLAQERIDRFEVVGFSLGGKLALATLEAFPEKVSRLVLLAPDGIATNGWYTLATYSLTVRLVFRSMIRHPWLFEFLAWFAGHTGLARQRVIRFARSQMETEAKRRRVYLSWVGFRKLTFNRQRMAQTLNEHAIPLLMIVSKYDKVTPPRKLRAFLDSVRIKQLEIMEVGHSDLIRAAGKLMVP